MLLSLSLLCIPIPKTVGYLCGDFKGHRPSTSALIVMAGRLHYIATLLVFLHKDEP